MCWDGSDSVGKGTIYNIVFQRENTDSCSNGELEESFNGKSRGQDANEGDVNKRKFVRDNSSGNYKHIYIHDTSDITN